MNMKTGGSGWFAAVLACVGLAAGGAWAATVSGSSGDGAFTASGEDLLQNNLSSVNNALVLYLDEGAFGTLATLTDGTAGATGREACHALSGGSVTYTLNTAYYTAGYDITSIDTYSGWQDFGRSSQHYEVSFRKVGASAFTDAITVDYGGGGSQNRVMITSVDVKNVAEVRFTFLSQQNNGVGYKELDVFGTASAPNTVVTGESSGSAYTVSSADLLQTYLGSTESTLVLAAENSGTLATLTDGSAGDNTSAGSYEIEGGSVTYLLDTAACPAGFDVTAVDTYTGWNDTGRDDQRYTVSFRKVGSSVFSDTVTVNYQGTISQTHVNIAGLALKGVEAVRFTFPAQENSGVGYKELDVIGATPSYADVTRLSSGAQAIASNGTSVVRIIEGTGDPRTNTLDSAVTVIDKLTQSATAGVATIDPAGQTLALNGIFLEPSAGGLAIGAGSDNGTLKSAGTGLLVDNLSASDVTVHSVIGNGAGPSLLTKLGAGALILTAANTYSGGTAVKAGQLRLAGSGSLGSGPVTVSGGTFQLDGGTVAPAVSSTFDLQFSSSTLNQTGGSLAYNGYGQFSDATLNLSGGTSGIGLDTLLGLVGASTTATISGSHTADWCVTRFVQGTVTVSLQSGGTLYSDRLYSSGATGALVFDGGRLGMSSRDPGRAPGDWISATAGSLSLLVRDGGAVIDTANGSAAINRPFLRDGASTGGLTKTGANTLTLTAIGPEAVSTYAGDTLIQGGTLKLSQVAVPLVIVNAGFEQPPQNAGGWSALYNDGVPGGWSWVFSDPDSTDKGGVARSGSPWVSAAPQGAQVSFIQGFSEMVQTNDVPVAATYRLSFSAANRPSHDADNLAFQVDGVAKGSVSYTAINNNGVFKSFVIDLGPLSPGPHEMKFVGTSPGGDTATAIDDIKIVKYDGVLPGTLPTGTRVAVSANATLDLNGASQTVAGLSGGGWVLNSSPDAATFTVGSDTDSTAFAGALSGAVALNKVGAGTLTLAGASGYGGETRILGGALILDAQVGSAYFATANAYSFTPAAGNLLAGLSPTEESNGSVGAEGTGTATVLTDGAIVADKPNTYTVGNNAVLTYTLSPAARGSHITQINIYAGWPDSGRENITLANISYSTVADQGTFIPIANSGVNYEGGTPDALAIVTAGGGLLAADVYAIRFSFGDQENGYVGYRELEVLGTRSLLPASTVATVAEGAVLDLKGSTQDLAGLNGGGLVTNGTLAVSGVIAPGGTNVVGTLTIASAVALSGTLLTDVALDGACDLLRVQGGLNLAGLALQIQDMDQLAGGTQYLIATCAPGGLTGRFASTNLGSKRIVYYNNAAGEVRLVGSGTLLMIN